MKIIFITKGEIEFTNAPDDLLMGGWYGGRQWDGNTFGMPGEINAGKIKKWKKYKEIENVRVFER